MSRSKGDLKGKVLNEDLLVKVKLLEPWPDPPPKKGLAPQSAQKSKGKVLDENLLVEVKPLEPWPDPPLKKRLYPESAQKPSRSTIGTGYTPKQPPKKN